MKILIQALLFTSASAWAIDGSLCPLKELRQLHGRKLADGRVDPTFDAAVEFPNLFLPSHLRFKPLSQWSDLEKQHAEEASKEARDHLEKAMATLFHRLTVPIVDEEGEVKAVRYFDHLQKQLSSIDPKVKVLPSGGVVRSGTGLIYALMLEGAEKGVSPKETLTQIIEGTHPVFDSEGNISALTIRGVGSDFDVLLDAPSSSFGALHAKAMSITNSSLAHFTGNQRLAHGSMGKAVFTVGDVKPLHDITDENGRVIQVGQMARSVRQGGSTLDFLAFDPSTGKFIEPKEHPHIVQDLLMGRYSYSEPIVGHAREDSSATVLRGLRALLEMPFLEMSDDVALTRDLHDLIEKARMNQFPTEKALEQISKMLRNARFSVANNRAHRSKSGSPLALFRQLCEVLKEKKKMGLLQTEQPLDIPVYVNRFPVGAQRRSVGDMPAEVIASSVMGREAFLKNYLKEGVINHGTPTVENALSITRGGLRVTMYEPGVRRGAYASNKSDVSTGYQRETGVLLKLRLKEGVGINVFDARQRSSRRFWRKLEQEARREGVETADILARDYGIDIIILDDSTMVIKNAEVIEPVDMGTLVTSFHSLMDNPKADPLERVSSLTTYQAILPYAAALGIKNLPQAVPKEKIFHDAKAILADSTQSDRLRFRALSAMIKLSPGAGEMSRIVEEMPSSVKVLAEGFRTDGGRGGWLLRSPDWMALFKAAAENGKAEEILRRPMEEYLAVAKNPKAENLDRLSALVALLHMENFVAHHFETEKGPLVEGIQGLSSNNLKFVPSALEDALTAGGYGAIDTEGIRRLMVSRGLNFFDRPRQKFLQRIEDKNLPLEDRLQSLFSLTAVQNEDSFQPPALPENLKGPLGELVQAFVLEAAPGWRSHRLIDFLAEQPEWPPQMWEAVRNEVTDPVDGEVDTSILYALYNQKSWPPDVEQLLIKAHQEKRIYNGGVGWNINRRVEELLKNRN